MYPMGAQFEEFLLNVARQRAAISLQRRVTMQRIATKLPIIQEWRRLRDSRV